MKKRIYIPVLLVLLAALPELALAAGPSPVAIAVCGAQSQTLPYPTAALDTGSTNCLADYPISYPAADFEGDGISYFVRSSALNLSARNDVYSDSFFREYVIPYPALGDADPSIEYVIPYPSAAEPAETPSAR